MNTYTRTTQHTTTPEPEYLSIPEAAEFCRVSHWTFRQWLSQGRLRRYHPKDSSRTLVKKADVLALIQPEE